MIVLEPKNIYRAIYLPGVLSLALFSVTASIVNVTKEASGERYEYQQAESRISNITTGTSLAESMKNAVRQSIQQSKENAELSKKGLDGSGASGCGKRCKRHLGDFQKKHEYSSTILSLNIGLPFFSPEAPPRKDQIENVHSFVISVHNAFHSFTEKFGASNDLQEAFYLYEENYSKVIKSYEKTPDQVSLVLSHFKQNIKKLFAGDPSIGFLIAVAIALFPDVANVTILALLREMKSPPTQRSVIRRREMAHTKRVKSIKQSAKEAKEIKELIMEEEKHLKGFMDKIADWIQLIAIYQNLSKGFNQIFKYDSEAKNDNVFKKDDVA